MLTTPNKPRLRKWVKALKSGKYKKQVKGALKIVRKKKVIGHCCLGVACEVFKQETRRGKWKGGTFIIDGLEDGSTLPEPVYKWFGLSGFNPRLETPLDGFGRLSASVLNDDFNQSFDDIAKAITRTFELTRAPRKKTKKTK